MEMRRVIEVSKETREFLVKTFKVTPRMVWLALAFGSDSDLARRIRALAMQKGGVLMNISPEVETIHDADGYMRQYLPNDVLIEVNKKTGLVEVFRQGEKVRFWDNPKMMEFEGIQKWAMSL